MVLTGMENTVKIWIRQLCDAANAEEGFYERFTDKLEASPAIYDELVYYAGIWIFYVNINCMDILWWISWYGRQIISRPNWTGGNTI